MTLRRLSFLQGLALVSGVACSSSSTTNPGPTETSVSGDALGDTATIDSSAGDTTTADGTPGDSTADATDSNRPDALADTLADAISDGAEGNKCRYSGGVAVSFLDCPPGRLCTMSSPTGPPTCEPGTDAGESCGTIQCAGWCSCLDAAKSICDCVGAAIGPLAPPELLSA